MKQVLMLSVLVILGVCFCCPLFAQSCQPSPACKAVCAELKADVAKTQTDLAAPAQTVTAQNSTGIVQFTSMNWFATDAVNKAALNCNPKNCDPTQCDPAKCDWLKCDPQKCDVPKCVPVNCSGGKAKMVRL